MADQPSSLNMESRFKKTPAGEIPVDWGADQLRNIAKTYSGGTPSRTNMHNYVGKIPWVKSGELRNDDIYDAEERISEEALASSSAKWVPKDSLLIAMYGATAGQVSMLRVDATANQAVLAVVPDALRVNHEYLRHAMKLQVPILVSRAQGAGQPNLSKELVDSVFVPLPPIHEQRLIADILASIDTAIERTRAVIEKAETVKKGLMKELLSRGLDKSRKRKKTPAGEIPVNWDIKPLGDVCQVQTGITVSQSRRSGNAVEVPYLAVANVQDGFIETDSLKRIAVTKDEVGRYSLRAEDVLFTEGGDNDKLGRGAVWDGRISPCLHQNHVFAVRCDGKVNPYFLALYAASPRGRLYFRIASKQTSNLASVNSTQLKAMPLPVPPLEEQNRIVEMLSSVDGFIGSLDTQKLKLEEIKRGLMTVLLTGRVRVRSS